MPDFLTATTNTLSRAENTDEGRAAIVQDISKQLEDDFKERDKLYQAIDTIVFLEDKIQIPENYKSSTLEVHSPLPLHIPATVTAALSVNEPTVQFPPVGKGNAGQTNATKREHFFEASWRRQQEEAERQLLRVFINALVVYGEGILKCVERRKSAWGSYSRDAKKLREKLDGDVKRKEIDSWASDDIYNAKTEEWKQGLPYPITTIDIDPLTFRYLRTLDGFSAVVEKKEIPYYDAFTRYGDKAYLDRNGNIVPQAMGQPQSEWASPSSAVPKLTMTELWTWRECVYVLQGPNQVDKDGPAARGVVVKKVAHGYGSRHTKTLSRGPYFHALGTTTASRLPHKAGLGVLTPFLSLFPQLNNLLTIQSSAAYNFGYPAFHQTIPPGAGDPPNPFGEDLPNGAGGTRGTSGTGKVVNITPGAILPFGVAPVEQPRGGVDLDKFIGQLRQFIELALPAVVQGAVSGDQSGYALNQAAHLAMLAWDPLIKNAQVALSRRVGFESWLIEHKIQEKVYVFGAAPTEGQQRKQGRGAWLSLGPEDLSGSHIYNVRLDPETPSNKLLDQRYWEAMVKAQFASVTQAQEAMGQNPDEVEEEILLWEMKQDPAVRERLKQRIFAELGLADQKLLQGNGRQADLTQSQGQPGDAIGNVMQPGVNMPITPPPNGARPVGPLSMGNPPGTPVLPGPPEGHMALPGQG